MNKLKQNKIGLMMREMEKNPRITLTRLSRILDMPISTLFDYSKEIEEQYTFEGVFFNIFDNMPVHTTQSKVIYKEHGLNHNNIKAIIRLIQKANAVQLDKIIEICKDKQENDN